MSDFVFLSDGPATPPPVAIAPIHSPTTAPPKLRRLPVLAPKPLEAPPAESSDLFSQVHRLATSGTVSLIVHLLLLLLLGVISLGSSDQPLALEVGFAESVSPTDSIDISFELPAAEEPEPIEIPDEPDIEEIKPLTLAEDVLEQQTEISQLLSNSAAMTELASEEPVDESVDGSGSETISGDAGVTGAKFYGIEAEGNRFVFVIDRSTSMSDGNRWARAVNELLESISMLRSDQQFLVLTYSSSFEPMMNMPYNNIRLLRATRKNKRRLFDWITRQVPNGVTMPARALAVGLTLNVDSIYLLSDGLLMDETESMLTIHNRARVVRFGTGRKTPVHTVGLDVAGEGAELLQRIAENNAGIFRVVQ